MQLLLTNIMPTNLGHRGRRLYSAQAVESMQSTLPMLAFTSAELQKAASSASSQTHRQSDSGLTAVDRISSFHNSAIDTKSTSSLKTQTEQTTHPHLL